MKTVDEFLAGHGFLVADQIDRQGLVGAFLDEMEKGLCGKASSLGMIPAFVGNISLVAEGARVAVLDAGGTNFRSAVVSFPLRIGSRRNRPMPGATREVSEEAFYSAFAEELLRVRAEANVDWAGWCFSYPCEATRELDARLNRWTKGIRAPSIVGQFVGRELARRTGGGPIAVINDTVATLLASRALEGAREFSSYIGFILGTGTNVAYVERNRGIAKLPNLEPEGSMVINAESGAFDKFARSDFDLAMDARQPDCGRNPFEKAIAGAYLGEVALEIFKGAAKERMFSDETSRAIRGLGALGTIALDEFCAAKERAAGGNPLQSVFKAEADAKMARRLGERVFERAAALTAVHLAAFAVRTGEGADALAPIAIGIDGSTYYKTATISFAELVKRELDDMLVNRRNIHYEIMPRIDDAPMIGAAIAALMQKERTEGR